MKLGDVVVGELEPGELEQLSCFVRRQRQVGESQLAEAAIGPQPLQRQPWIDPAGNDQAQPLLGEAQEPVQALDDPAGVQLLEIIEHERDRKVQPVDGGAQ